MYLGENSRKEWSKLEKSADLKRHFTLLNVSIEANKLKRIVERKKCASVNHTYLRKKL